MQVFRDLLIKGEADQLLATIEAIRETVSGDWRWDRVSEERLRTIGNSEPCYCFASLETDGHPAAAVFLTLKAPGILYVANVVPLTKHQLSNDEYNCILEDFFQRWVQPAAARTGATAEMTAARVDLERWLSAAAAQKLRGFSTAASKSTGPSQPSDRERWNAFVLSAHQEGSALDASTLRRWLIEVEGWAPEVAHPLAVEYEYGRELLAFADGGRRSA